MRQSLLVALGVAAAAAHYLAESDGLTVGVWAFSALGGALLTSEVWWPMLMGREDFSKDRLVPIWAAGFGVAVAIGRIWTLVPGILILIVGSYLIPFNTGQRDAERSSR